MLVRVESWEFWTCRCSLNCWKCGFSIFKDFDIFVYFKIPYEAHQPLKEIVLLMVQTDCRPLARPSCEWNNDLSYQHPLWILKLELSPTNPFSQRAQTFAPSLSLSLELPRLAGSAKPFAIPAHKSEGFCVFILCVEYNASLSQEWLHRPEAVTHTKCSNSPTRVSSPPHPAMKFCTDIIRS